MRDCPFPSPCLSAPLLPIWMNVASLNIWFSDFHTAWFSDNSGWYLFCSVVVFFATVVRGGKECLPMPPSWPEVHNFTFLYKLDQSNAVITWAKQLLPVVAGQSKYPAVGLIRNVKPFRRRPTMCIYICYPPVSHLVAFFLKLFYLFIWSTVKRQYTLEIQWHKVHCHDLRDIIQFSFLKKRKKIPFYNTALHNFTCPSRPFTNIRSINC